MSKSVRPNKKEKENRQVEYFMINLFSFAFIGILAIVVFNFSLFNPLKIALKDFSLTDFYYQKLANKNKQYPDSLIIVNVEDRERGEIAFLLQRIQQGNPKVVGMDIIFRERKDSIGDDLLKQQLVASNLVLPYVANFKGEGEAVYNHTFFGSKSESFVNLVGDDREFSTIRSYHPFYKEQAAFTSAIIHKYNPELEKYLLERNDKRTEIRYWGNIQNFKYYTFDEVMDPSFDPASFKNRIVLMGYAGIGANPNHNLDEDRFFTPLNPKMTGRSHPDMYGMIIHANILRMVIDKDFVKEIPTILNWIIAFLLNWLMIPLFAKWYLNKPMWFHFLTKVVQLVFAMLFAFLAIQLYAMFNIKLESAAILVAVLLLSDVIYFYDGFVKILRNKLNLNINSMFFHGHGH
ncbi:MAG TPA: CHASE2 domain-containing protein [Chitinophagaceae bacterium]